MGLALGLGLRLGLGSRFYSERLAGARLRVHDNVEAVRHRAVRALLERIELLHAVRPQVHHQVLRHGRRGSRAPWGLRGRTGRLPAATLLTRCRSRLPWRLSHCAAVALPTATPAAVAPPTALPSALIADTAAAASASVGAHPPG